MDLTLFFVVLTYPKPKELSAHLDAHQTWAERYSASGVFLLAGPLPSFGGGLILAQARSQEELTAILKEDPLYGAGLETFEIFEFAPRRGLLRTAKENPLLLTDAQRLSAFSAEVEGERRKTLATK